MRYLVSYSTDRDDEVVDAKNIDEVLRQIELRFPRNSIVGISGPRGGNSRFYMKREDGDIPWPISAATAATFVRTMNGAKR